MICTGFQIQSLNLKAVFFMVGTIVEKYFLKCLAFCLFTIVFRLLVLVGKISFINFQKNVGLLFSLIKILVYVAIVSSLYYTRFVDIYNFLVIFIVSPFNLSLVSMDCFISSVIHSHGLVLVRLLMTGACL